MAPEAPWNGPARPAGCGAGTRIADQLQHRTRVRARLLREDRRTLWWTLRKLHPRAPHTRATAAEGLGYSRDQRSVPPVMAALQDDHAAVRKAAAEALGQLGDARAVDPLVDALVETPLTLWRIWTS